MTIQVRDRNLDSQVDLAATSRLYDALAAEKSPFSDDERLKVAAMYVTEGNLAKVSRETKISLPTLHRWKDSTSWWPLAIAEFRRRKQDELDAEFSKVIHSAVAEVADRIIEGDWVMLKDGTKERLPMKGRDIAVSLSLLYDKRALLRGDMGPQESTGSQESKLDKLEKKFKEFAMQLEGKTIEGEAEEI